jgi:16S rRNA (cytidine1402-2'-O)-methyltransferase
MKNAGTLFVVATPIGNLGDITLRALETLKNVDLIACEDTRVTGNLLKHFDIKKPTISYFQHSKLSKIEYLISELESGKNIALVTDAGTPGISDPGQQLIAEIRNSNIEIRNNELTDQPINDIQIVPIPGASALTAAASVSGMIEKEFYFAGFLPKKKGRQTKFKEIFKLDVPIVIYESAMRLERTLGDFKIYFGENTEVFIAREISKMFEEYWGGKIDSLIADLPKHKLKGEIVLIIRKGSK